MSLEGIIRPKTPLQGKELKIANTLIEKQHVSLNELKESLARVKSAIRDTTITASSISDNTRVNEQELHASLTLVLLSALGKKKGRVFEEIFALQVTKLLKEKSPHAILRATRFALRSTVQKGMLPASSARIIRRIAIGRSQLDDERSSLLTKRLPEAKETPLRSMKTAFKKFLENAPFNKKEHKDFQDFVASAVRPESRPGPSSKTQF